MEYATERVVGQAVEEAVEAPHGTTISEVTGVQDGRAIVVPTTPVDDPVVLRFDPNGANETMAVTTDDIAVERDDVIEVEVA